MSESIVLHKTAGAIQNEILKQDHGSYTDKDLGYATCDDFWNQLEICIDNHQKLLATDPDLKKLFPDNEYCIIVQYATDPLLVSVIRRKFVPWPHLPDPRPQQSVFYYDQAADKLTLLWSLPGAQGMATLSEETVVPKEYVRMKAWSDWWFNVTFWGNIRKQHGIKMLSEHEFMIKNRKLSGKGIDNNHPALLSDPFYLPEVRIKKLEAKPYAGIAKVLDDIKRKSNGTNRDLHLKNLHTPLIARDDIMNI